MMYYLGSFEVIDLSLCHEIRSIPQIINSLHLARSPFSTVQNNYLKRFSIRSWFERDYRQAMVVTRHGCHQHRCNLK